MKKALLIIALIGLMQSAFASCELGLRLSTNYIQNGWLGTYDFGNGKVMQFRFADYPPSQVRFNFRSYLPCQ